MWLFVLEENTVYFDLQQSVLPFLVLERWVLQPYWLLSLHVPSALDFVHTTHVFQPKYTETLRNRRTKI